MKLARSQVRGDLLLALFVRVVVLMRAWPQLSPK